MQKRYHLKKERSVQQKQECIICQLKKVAITNLIQLSPKILIKRYYQPLSKTNQSITIHKLLSSRLFSNTKISYREAIQSSKQHQLLSNYHNFQTIVGRIKCIVLERVNKDRYTTVHFHGKAFQMTLRHQFATKRLVMGKQKNAKVDKNNGSGASTDSDQNYKKDKLVQFKHQAPFPKQSQATSLRKLTRNLSTMVKKFDDNLQFHPSLIFQIMEIVPGHALDLTKLQKQQIFKKQLQQNISIIADKKAIQRLHTVADDACELYQENYGLKIRQKIGQSRKLIRNDYKMSTKLLSIKKGQLDMKQNISPNQRVHTDYDCQKIRRSKKKSISNKKSNQKFGMAPMGAFSRNKGSASAKVISASKSRVTKKN